jgi:hypothetical protein
MPYCEPHYPKTVATAVVDTPEMQRVAVNTRLQSQVGFCGCAGRIWLVFLEGFEEN